MSYQAMFEIKYDDKTTLIVRGGVDGGNCNLEFELPDSKKSIKAEWTKQDIVKFGTRDLPEGLPAKITIDKNHSKNVFYRNQRFYEAGQSQPWSASDLAPWGEIFSRMSRGAAILPDINFDRALIEARDIESWAGCVGSFAGAGGGIGAAVGSSGGPAGAATGGAVGAAIGGSFGVGYCSAKK
jgi:hypothetical protein